MVMMMMNTRTRGTWRVRPFTPTESQFSFQSAYCPISTVGSQCRSEADPVQGSRGSLYDLHGVWVRTSERLKDADNGGMMVDGFIDERVRQRWRRLAPPNSRFPRTDLLCNIQIYTQWLYIYNTYLQHKLQRGTIQNGWLHECLWLSYFTWYDRWSEYIQMIITDGNYIILQEH